MHRIVALAFVLLTLPVALLAAAPATQEACRQLLGRWEARLQKDGFAACISPPFVIVGDMPQSSLEGWRDETVAPAAAALRSAYFATAPSEPVMIMLFSTEKSYREHANRWFGDTGVSPYGYFRQDRVMLLNIATGGGTLVHEMVHALLRPDFPQCPDWVNEGMGSLYEQCTLAPLTGLTNWRLAGLQQAIRDKKLRPLHELVQDPAFYREDLVGVNYAQARYLLMYLQERRLLARFYKQLRQSHGTDPTGLNTIEAVLATDLKTLDPLWRDWVLTLHFP